MLAVLALGAAVVPITEEIDHGDDYAEFRDLETVELDRMDVRGVSAAWWCACVGGAARRRKGSKEEEKKKNSP